MKHLQKLNTTTIQDVIRELERLAPASYQEGYDNAGLLVGSPATIVQGILFSLDVTEQVVEEARARGCNMIVAHHPIIFKGLKKLNGKNYVERTVIQAIKNDIAIYAIHTNLDRVQQGVNWKLAQQLGLQDLRVLAPKKQLLAKLAFFVPVENTQEVLQALFNAGAGQIGGYSECSFRVQGTGSFRPGDGANPAIGKRGERKEVTEDRVEIMFPAFLESKILSTLRKAHPYEEVAYYLSALENENQEVGAGAVGTLKSPMPVQEFLQWVKESMQLRLIRHTEAAGEMIRTVAVCGGAGSFLLTNAKAAGADAFITADYKYHEFFDAEDKIMICDIGHYESEVLTKNLLYEYLSKIFDNFALCLSEVNTNPVRYFV